MEILYILLAIVVAVPIVYLYMKAETKKKGQERERQRRIGEWQQRVRQAERAVEVSDPITRQIIDVLREADSSFYQDAIALRRKQVEQGRVE